MIRVKRRWSAGIWCAALYLFFICGAGFADIGETIQAGSEYDYPPFCIVSEDGEADGFSVELLRARFKLLIWTLRLKSGLGMN